MKSWLLASLVFFSIPILASAQQKYTYIPYNTYHFSSHFTMVQATVTTNENQLGRLDLFNFRKNGWSWGLMSVFSRGYHINPTKYSFDIPGVGYEPTGLGPIQAINNPNNTNVFAYVLPVSLYNPISSTRGRTIGWEARGYFFPLGAISAPETYFNKQMTRNKDVDGQSVRVAEYPRIYDFALRYDTYLLSAALVYRHQGGRFRTLESWTAVDNASTWYGNNRLSGWYIEGSIGLSWINTDRRSSSKRVPAPNPRLRINFDEDHASIIMEQGTTKTIRFRVHNDGKGMAENVVANFSFSPKAHTNALVLPENYAVGNIAPNSSAIVSIPIFAPKIDEMMGDVALSVHTTVVEKDRFTASRDFTTIVKTNRAVRVDTLGPTIIVEHISYSNADTVSLEQAQQRGLSKIARFATVSGLIADESKIDRVLAEGKPLSIDQTGRFKATFDLKQTGSAVWIQAFDVHQNVSFRSIDFEVTTEVEAVAMPTAKVGRDYALFIATDEYDQWTNLVNPIFDAETMSSELSKNYGFSTEIVKNPTRNELLSTLRRYAQKSFHEDDQLLIFIAGHGHYDEVFREGYLVTRESELDDENKTTYIPHSTLKTIIDNIPNKHIMLVLDVCFSGTFNQQVALNRSAEIYAEMSREEFVTRKKQYVTRKFITSGGKEYVSDGLRGQHSPFVRNLLTGLRTYGDKDGLLTSHKLFTFVERTNPTPIFGEFGKNEPGSDFLFVVKTSE